MIVGDARLLRGDRGAHMPDRWARDMPDRWARDMPRRRAAGIPADLVFATKQQLAMRQLARRPAR